ncbi:FKBP-type peptidyl-prolyl cis-trans isomerase [Nocardioides bizhenqiangii]|uniref:peptidylprolyl isomerase n=1 Tax=Nocardioides bizhenqiangii TaxID=3095076 RepID=A0ABZ0ZJA2_9ACTN|nr:FKBP-type peptidyl-prolyl cis-trans isomerase [Nocardioides sp. HM61]WQQ24577.1 FKBP-type peptidyl-prolyl cis-trans isomerase [Nocardioides sp. HM61]
MLSRLTRPTALTAVSLCALAVLTACGDDSPEGETASGFDAVEVSGPVGEVPEVDWSAMLEPGETEAQVVEEGDGAVIEDGDKVLTNLAISNDFGQDISFDTYSDQGVLLEVGSEAEPAQVVDLMTQLVKDEIEPGTTTVGTRVAIVADAEEEFGDLALNLSSLGIGNEDGFVLVADFEAVALDGPEGKTRPAPAWAPEIVQEKGKPTALDSSGLPEPDPKATELGKAVLVEGTGPVVEKGQQIVANYIGQVYGAKKPFDSGYARPDPAIFEIGTGAVVKGWDQGLVGEKVGSRVLLEIPPKLGYGKKGQGEDIPGDSTLYFVVDILAAA